MTTHGFAPTLDKQKFDLRKTGSDAADEHAVRHFAHLISEQMQDDKNRNPTSVPWYAEKQFGTQEEHVIAIGNLAAASDWVALATCAMMLCIREELAK